MGASTHDKHGLYAVSLLAYNARFAKDGIHAHSPEGAYL